jgi:hypothetical protein
MFKISIHIYITITRTEIQKLNKQRKAAHFKNKSLPASSFAEASGVKAEADTSTAAAMALAKRVEIIFCI